MANQKCEDYGDEMVPRLRHSCEERIDKSRMRRLTHTRLSRRRDINARSKSMNEICDSLPKSSGCEVATLRRLERQGAGQQGSQTFGWGAGGFRCFGRPSGPGKGNPSKTVGFLRFFAMVGNFPFVK